MEAADDLRRRFGERCRALRRRRKLSQLDMVRRYDISLSHYQKIERGDLDVRLSTAKKLADCFDVTLAELMRGV
ncbi:MAG TPA: helix-turn-helix transcriptional regulator [Kofleriaceae bacterium]|nr:helix-turn-helix transcriptional regulator [Kofleriaceae bacterium]